jgi:hypothetical protein
MQLISQSLMKIPATAAVAALGLVVWAVGHQSHLVQDYTGAKASTSSITGQITTGSVNETQYFAIFILINERVDTKSFYYK